MFGVPPLPRLGTAFSEAVLGPELIDWTLTQRNGFPSRVLSVGPPTDGPVVF